MNTPFFSIIIPNYNNAPFLEKNLTSVLNQTFTDYELIFIDDCSSDNSVNIVTQIFERYKDIPFKKTLLTPAKKIWNGGSRNLGVASAQGKYLLFLDSDDWFLHSDILKHLYNFITSNHYPDLIRLPFKILTNDDQELNIMLDDDTPQKLVDSCFVACWTKCLKKDKYVPFPENTLMEDVVQHIAICDVITTIAVFPEMVVNYNRKTNNSCSLNPHLQNRKWESSMYRYYADLFDLVCQHDYCEAHRQRRLQDAKNNIDKGLAIQ